MRLINNSLQVRPFAQIDTPGHKSIRHSPHACQDEQDVYEHRQTQSTTGLSSRRSSRDDARYQRRPVDGGRNQQSEPERLFFLAGWSRTEMLAAASVLPKLNAQFRTRFRNLVGEQRKQKTYSPQADAHPEVCPGMNRHNNKKSLTTQRSRVR